MEIGFRGPEIQFRVGPPVEPVPEARPLAARLRGVEAAPGDRVLRFHLQRVRGKAESPVLVVEMTGARGNVVMVGRTSGRILSVLFQREGTRHLQSGHPYPELTRPDRPGVEGDVLAGVSMADRAWVSPINRTPLRDLEETDPDRAQSLWRELARIGRLGIPGQRPGSDDPEPPFSAGLLDPDGALQPYPAALPDMAWEASESLLAALEGAAGRGDRGSGDRDSERRSSPGGPGEAPDTGESSAGTPAPYVPASVLKGLEDAAKSASRTVRSLTRERDRLPDPADLRSKADLLLARAGEVRRGAEAAELTGFDGTVVEVRLDPRLDGPANARKLYDEAARAERAIQDLPGRLASAEDALRTAEERLDAARAGQVPEDVERSSSPAQSTSRAPLPYRVFRTSGGIEVRVGRGSRKNDDLTFHHARPMDVWLHARGVPGAHVVLRWNREEKPPARDLEEAAGLAALYSRARHSSSVPVDWTRRKHVRKPRKAAPGSVVPDRVETVFVDPDPELVERLRVED